jgi:hypothetical protein
MKALGKRSLASVLAILVDVVWYVVLAALAVTVVLVATRSSVSPQLGPSGAPNVVSGATMSIPVMFTLEPDAQRVRAPSLGIDAAEIRDVRGTLRFTPQGGTFLAINLVLLVCGLGLVLWVLSQLRALFRTLRNAQPFAAANATRVRRIGWAVIGGELLRSGMMFFESYYAKTHFIADALRFEARPDLSLFVIVNGVIILVIAEVFRTGTRLDEDQSLTV